MRGQQWGRTGPNNTIHFSVTSGRSRRGLSTKLKKRRPGCSCGGTHLQAHLGRTSQQKDETSGRRRSLSARPIEGGDRRSSGMGQVPRRPRPPWLTRRPCRGKGRRKRARAEGEGENGDEAARPAVALSGSALSVREVVALKRAFVEVWGGLGGHGAGALSTPARPGWPSCRPPAPWAPRWRWSSWAAKRPGCWAGRRPARWSRGPAAC